MSNNKKKITIDNSYYKKHLSASELTIRNRLLRCETGKEAAQVWNELLHPDKTLGADGKPKLDRPLNQAETRMVMKTLCKIDRVYLAMVLADGGKNEGLLPILKHPWVFSRCREVEREPDNHLDLWGRGHYKSTIITVMGAVQELLINPTLTILILTYTNKFGYDILTKIKKSLMNPILTDLFSDTLYANPDKEAPTGGWTKDQIFIKGNVRGNSASIAFSSVEGGGKTGHHAQLLIYDDLVVESSVGTKESREKSVKAFDMSSNLGSQGGGINRRQLVGTRYHKDDCYNYMMVSGQIKPRIRPATHNGQMDGIPVYLKPEEWADQLKKSDYVVACQMLQNPILSSEAIFDYKYLLGYSKLKPMNIFIMVDYAVSKKNRSDYTSMAVVGMDDHGTKYLLDGVRDKLNLEDTWYHLRNLHEKWSGFLENYSFTQHSILVAYEKESANRDIESLEMLMKRDDYYFDIIPYSSGRQAKVDKIKKLIVDFKNNINGKRGGFRIPNIVYREGHYYKWEIVEGENGVKYEMKFHQVDSKPYKEMEDLEIIDLSGLKYEKMLEKVHPLKKFDRDGMAYDYTMEFFNEFENFPFSANDDILDSIASLYSIPDIADYMGGLARVSQSSLLDQPKNNYNY